MSTGPRKDASPTSPEKPSADPADGLVTSQDLFGDLIDAPLEPERPPAAARSAPIRVQVSETGEAGPKKPKAPEVQPEEMASLLDAFAEAAPAEAAAATPEEPPPARAASPLSASDEEDLSGMLDSLEGPAAPEPPPIAEAPPPVATEATVAPPAGEEEVSMDDLLGDLTGAEAEHRPAAMAGPILDVISGRDPEKTVAPGRLVSPFATPKPEPAPKAEPPTPEAQAPMSSRATKPPTDLDSLLEDAIAPSLPADTAKAEIVEPLEMVKPAARLGTKFAAVEPKIAASGESRMMLDLGALAEDAFTAPPPPRDSEAGGSREGVGDTYGPYHLVEKVAAGGMAEVFRAKRTGVEGFEKVVAVKRILPHLSDNKEFVDMFIDEAKMVAGLTHPNIVQIFDLGKIERTYFIAMEYIHGRDLRTILRRAKDRGIRIPLDLSVLIVSRVCAALEYAHRKKDETGRSLRIVHRDISPQNILISFEGDVKLTDFGIAKATTKATSTDKGALRGKLLYMSPEQAWGKPMDRRSDVFSLGIVFYEMITDRKPFLGTSEKGILEMVRECRITPPSAQNPRIPERIEKVVMRALARESEQRYQDAGEMLKELERALHERQPPSATELARFMEVLFERDERGERAPSDAGQDSDRHRADGHFEIDMGPEEEPEPQSPGGEAGIGKLLKKFGIK